MRREERGCRFLVELKEVCATQDKQMAERTAARQVEMKAVGEALQILADNDNKDLFTKSPRSRDNAR